MILVFKTNVKYKRQIKELQPVLDEIKLISRWNFDLADCDKIFRIECPGNISAEIINILEVNGFKCEELE